MSEETYRACRGIYGTCSCERRQTEPCAAMIRSTGKVRTATTEAKRIAQAINWSEQEE